MEAEAVVQPYPGFWRGQGICEEIRHSPHFRRNDYWLPLASGWCAEIPWGCSASVHVWEGIGEWICDLRVDGQARNHAAGGLDHNDPRVFLLSTTHGAETHAFAAALETIRFYQNHEVIEQLWALGANLQKLVNCSISENQLSKHFVIVGRPCNLVFATLDEKCQPSQAFRTLFMDCLIQRGVIAPSFVVSYSHTESDIKQTADAVFEAHRIYRQALASGIGKFLRGRSVKPVNRRFN